MRIPGLKIWRAFEELDHLTDSECQSLIVRAYLFTTPSHIFLRGLSVVLAAIAATGGIAYLIRDMFKHDNSLFVAIVILAATLTLLICILHLLARDLHLYFLIRKDLRRAHCPKCKQSLIGLPVLQTALHPGTPGDARVRCPECGREWVLMEIGLNIRDLIPFEERVPDAQVGTLRKGSNWKGTRRPR